MSGRTALVVGGAGAIGSRLSARLLEQGYGVVVLDDLSSGHRDTVPSGAALTVGDCSDPAVLDTVFGAHRFVSVFHLAALFANANSIEHPERDLEVSGLATLRLLQKSAQVPGLERFVYISSSCVHGSAAGPLEEDTPFDPETPYGITKILGEMYTKYFGRQYGLPISIIRPFNTYGPGEYPGRYRNVIPNFIQAALRHTPLLVTGDGTETRDFTFNEDLVDGIARASTSPRAIGSTYNMGSGKETTIGDLARHIVALTGSQSTIEFVPRRSWDHTRTRCADIRAAEQDLGYSAPTTIEVGLKATIAWLQDRL